jgi:hypothetical protein
LDVLLLIPPFVKNLYRDPVVNFLDDDIPQKIVSSSLLIWTSVRIPYNLFHSAIASESNIQLVTKILLLSHTL